jgi:6-phosphofructo-2-kinase/fructose-2,6-biphosphatase 2
LNVKIFNVGEYRRRMFGSCKNAEWFDRENEEGLRMREECNTAAIDDMVQFFTETSSGVSTSSLAIFDATNATRVQRAKILQKVKPTPTPRERARVHANRLPMSRVPCHIS